MVLVAFLGLVDVLRPGLDALRPSLLLLALLLPPLSSFRREDSLHGFFLFRRDGEPSNDLLVGEPVSRVTLMSCPLDLRSSASCIMRLANYSLHIPFSLGFAPVRLLAAQPD